ncbi:MAG: hypothetical protein K8W52_27810 [Deltaproteobacteria bacterium]|nr:hypothetical protein [Deltaproteobacteria bacterium]
MSAEARLGDNPLLVLGLGLGATRMEVERQAQLLLGMLELGFPDAATYPSPLGPRPRTPDLVRAAAAALRDPGQRLQAELWFVPADASGDRTPTPETSSPPSTSTSDSRTESIWTDALARLGWGPAREAR